MEYAIDTPVARPLRDAYGVRAQRRFQHRADQLLERRVVDAANVVEHRRHGGLVCGVDEIGNLWRRVVVIRVLTLGHVVRGRSRVLVIEPRKRPALFPRLGARSCALAHAGADQVVELVIALGLGQDAPFGRQLPVPALPAGFGRSDNRPCVYQRLSRELNAVLVDRIVTTRRFDFSLRGCHPGAVGHLVVYLSGRHRPTLLEHAQEVNDIGALIAEVRCGHGFRVWL